MKKILFLFIFLYGCITMGIRGNGNYIFNPSLKKDIENHGYEGFKEISPGFSFGMGFFHPDYFLIRGKFSQIFSENSKTKFYSEEGWIEGGAKVFGNKIFSFYPLIGFGVENQIVKISKRFEGLTYGISFGFENHLILTKEKPGYLAFAFGANYKRIAGAFLDAPHDYLISRNHSYFEIFLGVEMGFIYEYK